MNTLIGRLLNQFISILKFFSTPTLIFLLLAGSYLIALGLPAFQGESYLLAQLNGNYEYDRINSYLSTETEKTAENARIAVKENGSSGINQLIKRSGVISYNMVVQVEVSLGNKIEGDRYSPIVIENLKPEITPHIRYDNITLVLGTAFILGLVVSYVVRERRTVSSSSESDALIADIRGQSNERVGGLALAEGSAAEVLAASINGAEKQSGVLFSRSTLLLTGGILMSFIGVLVFYITLPDLATYESTSGANEGNSSSLLSKYLLKAIRPMGVLLFVEAIAWFLLRQYRELMEDYKSFHKTYLRRMNLLAAQKVTCKENVRTEELFLATALLGDDLSGKLRQGETTENLERIKIDEPNPIFALVTSIINSTSNKKEEKKDGQ